ncbi:MAG: hypothetical protein ABH821_01650 [archaeon]
MVFTSNVTIALEKKVENVLRSLASDKYNNKKGALAKVVSESLYLLSNKNRRQKAMERQFKLMDKGFNLGRIKVKCRDELYS